MKTMKKTILLFTLVCAGALNSMESAYGHYTGSGEVSPEIKKTLHSYANLDDTIKAIKAMSGTNNELSDLKKFTALVHKLANKFNENTYTIANKFNTKVSNEYIALSDTLMVSILNDNPGEVRQAINNGADVNFNDRFYNTPLKWARSRNNSQKIVQMLLDAGAQE